MNYIDEFILYLASEKGLSQNTLAAYRSDLALFFQKVQKREGVISREDVIFYISYLHQEGYQVRSIARILTTIRVFFRFLKRERWISEDPTLHLDAPKLGFFLPTVLSVEEVGRMLELFTETDEFSLRNRAILETLYASGLRVSELCGLNVHDVGSREVRAMGKGSKERIVPLADRTIWLIREYLSFRSIPEKENPPLFVTQRGRRVNRQMVWRLVVDAGRESGITKEISPHTLRHSYATHLLEGGADIRVIQELLGHAHIGTTDVYTHISKKHLKTAFDKHHPRNA